jgi:hypothetical protein
MIVDKKKEEVTDRHEQCLYWQNEIIDICTKIKDIEFGRKHIEEIGEISKSICLDCDDTSFSEKINYVQIATKVFLRLLNFFFNHDLIIEEKLLMDIMERIYFDVVVYFKSYNINNPVGFIKKI